MRIATLNDARSRRSAEKRAAVEDAIMRLRDTRQAVTFVSVAREAKVIGCHESYRFSEK